MLNLTRTVRGSGERLDTKFLETTTQAEISQLRCARFVKGLLGTLYCNAVHWCFTRSSKRSLYQCAKYLFISVPRARRLFSFFTVLSTITSTAKAHNLQKTLRTAVVPCCAMLRHAVPACSFPSLSAWQHVNASVDASLGPLNRPSGVQACIQASVNLQSPPDKERLQSEILAKHTICATPWTSSWGPDQCLGEELPSQTKSEDFIDTESSDSRVTVKENTQGHTPWTVTSVLLLRSRKPNVWWWRCLRASQRCKRGSNRCVKPWVAKPCYALPRGFLQDESVWTGGNSKAMLRKHA